MDEHKNDLAGLSGRALRARTGMRGARRVAVQLRSWERGDHLRATPELILCGALVVGICLGATLVPLRLSARRLELMEW